eukprot:767270-Hanusia_phi.AAC.3
MMIACCFHCPFDCGTTLSLRKYVDMLNAQQLLRARRICSPIDVNELAIPFSVEKSSVTVRLSDDIPRNAHAPMFSSSTTRTAASQGSISNSWQKSEWEFNSTGMFPPLRCRNSFQGSTMKGSGPEVLSDLKVFSSSHFCTQRTLSLMGERRNESLAGDTYQDRETHRSFELEVRRRCLILVFLVTRCQMEKMDTMRGSETVEVEPRTNQSPLFTESDCCAR